MKLLILFIIIVIVTAKPDCGCDQAMDWNPPHPPHHKLLNANISAISQPIELKFFLVTLQWVLVMTRLKNKLGLS